MNTNHLPSTDQRRLVQQIVNGSIPAGKDFEECRSVLLSDCDDASFFDALFTLLRGALADPFTGIKETEQVVPILKALARGEMDPRKLM